MSNNTIASPIKWHGGKSYLAPKLIPYLPPHLHRVHPYAGGLSEMFAWPHEGVSEVVNDIHEELSNFWQVIRGDFTFDKFKRIIEATPFSESEFEKACEKFKRSGLSTYGDIKAAANFFIRCRQSRQGLMKDFATLSRNRVRRGMNEQVSAWLSSVDGLPEIHDRLKRVVILNRPALDVIRQQDGEYTFFYCDPPYLPETRSTTGEYEHEMTFADHDELLLALSKIKGKFMLSGYPSDLYEDAEKMHGWNHVDFDLPNNASSAKEKERKIERVWMNYVRA